MIPRLRYVALASASLFFCFGCKKTPPNPIADYMSALNAYYAGNPACVWPAPEQLPIQVLPSDTARNEMFTTLVDEGLLMRVAPSDKRPGTVLKGAINYDLSAEGRAAWTADAYHLGLGNFCYGTRSVMWIGLTSPTRGKPGDTTIVNFGYTFNGAPDWAKDPEIQKIFPQIKADLNMPSVGITRATLVKTETGWQVQSVQPTPKPTTPAIQ
jgi:hypothetical protein